MKDVLIVHVFLLLIVSCNPSRPFTFDNCHSQVKFRGFIKLNIIVASDQYGNYLIQHILQTAPVPLREIVAAHIRKHMVSLRGSKFGSRVGMLCINHNYLNYQPRGHGTTNVNNGHGAHGGGSISGGAGHRHGNSNRWGYR